VAVLPPLPHHHGTATPLSHHHSNRRHSYHHHSHSHSHYHHHTLQTSSAAARSSAALQREAAARAAPGVVYGGMIPDPDYSDAEDSDQCSRARPRDAPTSYNTLNPGTSKHSRSIKSSGTSVKSPSRGSPSPSSPVKVSSVRGSPVGGSSARGSPEKEVLPLQQSSAHNTAAMGVRTNLLSPSGEDGDRKTPSPLNPSPLLPRHDKNANNSNRFDENGCILPKKLLNPSLESTEKKSLHRELLFNQKAGVSVLNQKSELQRALQKHADKQKSREVEREKEEGLTPFQRALQQQATKLELNTAPPVAPPTQEPPAHEFQKLQAKIKSKMEAQ